MLLLDANVVIKLFDLALWDRFIERFDVCVSKIIADEEAIFYQDGESRRPIVLQSYIEHGRIKQIDVSASTVIAFQRRFRDPAYLDRLDPGESELLAFLIESGESHLISSSDAIVFRVLGRLRLAERGVSLEELLQRAGLGRKIEYQYTKRFRLWWTDKGSIDAIQGGAI